jgi:uncharacterized membrane protein YbhN (UPF0104 family)
MIDNGREGSGHKLFSILRFFMRYKEEKICIFVFIAAFVDTVADLSALYAAHPCAGKVNGWLSILHIYNFGAVLRAISRIFPAQAN